MTGARIGRGLLPGAERVRGRPTSSSAISVKIQNNVSIYSGVTLEDDVFCGPSMVFTNVINPRSEIERKDEFRKTLVKKGVSIGANATIVCGVTLGTYAFIGAGAVVTHDVPDFAIVTGKPGTSFRMDVLLRAPPHVPGHARRVRRLRRAIRAERTPRCPARVTLPHAWRAHPEASGNRLRPPGCRAAPELVGEVVPRSNPGRVDTPAIEPPGFLESAPDTRAVARLVEHEVRPRGAEEARGQDGKTAVRVLDDLEAVGEGFGAIVRGQSLQAHVGMLDERDRRRERHLAVGAHIVTPREARDGPDDMEGPLGGERARRREKSQVGRVLPDEERPRPTVRAIGIRIVAVEQRPVDAVVLNRHPRQSAEALRDIRAGDADEVEAEGHLVLDLDDGQMDPVPQIVGYAIDERGLGGEALEPLEKQELESAVEDDPVGGGDEGLDAEGRISRSRRNSPIVPRLRRRKRRLAGCHGVYHA